jgi:oligopeptide/dipeptide ABC transporter ATP-binding protein
MQQQEQSLESVDNNTEILLNVKDLTVSFLLENGKQVLAVDDVSFEIGRGEVLGLVGESGSGKTMTALSILQLQPYTAKMRGQVLYRTTKEERSQKQDLTSLPEKKLRSIRGKEIAIVFQDPLSSLNPVYRVGDQIVEAIRLHEKIPKKIAKERAIELMRRVGIQSPEKRARDFPHQLSGGMRQRVMIAMALSMEPKLLIADEPTTMIDEISQMQIIELLKGLKNNFAAILYITHDLGVVAELCNRIAVMYAGRIVETGNVLDIFKDPKHPYTKLLIESIPRVDRKKQDLVSIPGMITTNIDPKSECRFVNRCPYASQQCMESLPELEVIPNAQGHFTACIKWKEIFPEKLVQS